jgi:hypothetical protein
MTVPTLETTPISARVAVDARDELIAAGRAQPHHVLPDSGWLTVPIRTVADLRNAVEIFRPSYERAAAKTARVPSNHRR